MSRKNRRSGRSYPSAAIPAAAAEVQLLEHRQLLAAAPVDIAATDDRMPVRLPECNLPIAPTVIALPVAGGTVNVNVSRNGEINITGDDSDNFVVIDISTGRLELSSWGAGTKFRGAERGQPVETLSVTLPKSLRSLSINLRGGNDTLYVRFNSDLKFSRDLNINTGDGNDFIDVSLGQSTVSFGNDIIVDLAGGDDTSKLTLQQSGNLIASRDIHVRSGNGDDSLLFIDYSSIPADALETPENFRALADNNKALIPRPVRSGRDFIAELGNGDDQLTLLTAAAGRDLIVQTGAGTDHTLLSHISTGRHLSILNAENQALQNIRTAGTLTIQTSNLSTTTFLDRTSAGRLDVALGAGNDKFSLGEFVSVRGISLVHGGSGTNLVQSAKPLPRIAFRKTVPSLLPEQTLQILAGILAAVPRPLIMIQCF